MHYLKGLIAASVLALSHTAHSDDAIRVIVKYRQTPYSFTGVKQQLAAAAPLPVKDIVPLANHAYVLIMDKKKGQNTFSATKVTTEQALAELRRQPNVVYAVKDRKGYIKPLPKPRALKPLKEMPTHKVQWDEFTPPAGIMLESLPGLNDGAWFYTTGLAKEPVVVAVLDTGIVKHEALNDSLIKDENDALWGWNFAGQNADVIDETDSYHGSHVAGTIAGFSDVMQGIGKDLKILPVKIPDASGMFYESAVINALYWSVGESIPGVPDNPYPAQVFNMSFGVDEKPGKEVEECDEALQDAVDFARNKGATLVVAAGNDDQGDHFKAPAVCKGTLKIAATGPEGLRAYYSNYGPLVSFAAPGGDLRYGSLGGILSSVHPEKGYKKSGYDFYQGTSMASPHVAGVAGLVIAASNKPLSPQEVETLLFATTHEFGNSDEDDEACLGEQSCGHGILDANNAVQAAIAGYDVILSAPQSDALSEDESDWIAVDAPKSYPNNPAPAFVYHHPENGLIYAKANGLHYKLNEDN